MGRIKTRLTKRITNELMVKHGDKLKDNFEENKLIVSQYVTIPSTKIRNVIAGYATRLKRSGQKSISLRLQMEHKNEKSQHEA